jgi:F-type H+-transporting ATPase subunit a
MVEWSEVFTITSELSLWNGKIFRFMDSFHSFFHSFYLLPSAASDGLDSIGSIPQWSFTVAGVSVSFSVLPLVMTWIIMAGLVLLAWVGTRNLKQAPGPLQFFLEVIVEAFDNLCKDTLGQKVGRTYMPLVTTLFLFIVIANIIGIFPGMEEPTKDMNTPVAFAVIVFFVVHFSGFYFKGFRYLLEFFEPMIEIGPIKLPNLFMFALNVVGEIGKVISHAFRLFGNVLGSSIIILVISSLIRSFALPIPLQAILGLGIGVIQAFVFAMLALTYVAVAIVDE